MESLSNLIRATNVYSTAFQVYWNIRNTQSKERRVKKRLGVALDDDFFENHPDIDSLWEETHEQNAKIISQAIVQLKGLWIKVGQFLSSRPDIMPMPYIFHFKKLQDALPFSPWSEVEATLLSSLGHDYRDKYFASVDESPISCASIAQVHKGTLKTGQDVVIKARHPNVYQLMHSDLKNLMTLCNWIAWVNPEYDFRKVCEEWIPAVKEEIDLRNEARNLNQIRENMEKAGIRVILPKIPDERLVTEDVLVMEYCSGISVREVDAFEKYKIDKMKLLERICSAWATQMYVNGIFNADPHPGNILISTDPKQNGGDASVPILLDFGLTRTLSDPIRIAFSKLVHSTYVMDVDGLLHAFEEMGLKIREKDPFQDIYNLRSYFQTVPASEAKSVMEKRLKDYKMKQKDRPKTKRPIDAWPGELVFFLRVTGLLKGLCSTMDVKYPYLKTTALVARETIKNSFEENQRAKDLFFPESLAENELLQKKIQKVVRNLHSDGQMHGMQIAVIHKGKFVTDISAGTLSDSDPRPVRPDTLFNVFSVTKAFAAALLNMAVQRSDADYDDLVSKYWPGFEENGKAEVTIRHVLNHQAGLANKRPENVTIEEFLDWTKMKEFLRKASPDHIPGEKEEYHYYTFGYIVGGILDGMTKKSFGELVKEWIVDPLDLQNQLFVGLPKEIPDDRLAVLHNGFLANIEDGMLASIERKTDSAERPKWERWRAAEHMANPTTFNMRQVREACIPSANGHMTARALARFYQAIISPENKILDLQPLFDNMERSKVQKLRQNDRDYGVARTETTLGFRIYKFRRNRDRKIVYGIGHPGLGGSVAFGIPEEDFSVAILKSYLTNDYTVVRILIQEISQYLGLTFIQDS